MGPAKGKLVDFEDFVGAFRHHMDAIRNLSSYRIDTLDDHEVETVASKIWRVIAELKIGRGEATIVRGSKALHHLLPDLVPPILIRP